MILALALHGGTPVWLALTLAIAAALLVRRLYRHDAGRPRARQAGLLLRILTLFFVLFLMLRPTMELHVESDRTRPIALLVDDSASMAMIDKRETSQDVARETLVFGQSRGHHRRIDFARQVLADPKRGFLERLGKIAPLASSTFGTLRSRRSGPKWYEQLAAKEPKSALHESILDLLNREDAEKPGAIVIFTDGRDNVPSHSVDEVAAACRNLEIPLHIYGIGVSGGGSLRIHEAVVPELLFVDDLAALSLDVGVEGDINGPCVAIVKLDQREVARKEFDPRTSKRIDLPFSPSRADLGPGGRDLSVELQAGTGVVDRTTKPVRILDRKLKVLVVDQLPRRDFRYLRSALLRDRRVDASFLLLDADPRATASAPYVKAFPSTAPELARLDLVILGDVDAAVFPVEQRRLLRDYVAEGGGLILLSGPDAAPATFGGTELASLLPIELRTLPTLARPYKARLTDYGARSPMLRLADDDDESRRIWENLPDLFACYPATTLKPAADVYLERVEGNRRIPLLVGHYYGKGSVLFLGFDESWRWRYDTADKIFGRFWTQAIYATAASGGRRLQLLLDDPAPLTGSSGRLHVRVLDREMRPVQLDHVTATIDRLGDDLKPTRIAALDLPALPDRPGDFAAVLAYGVPGRYVARIEVGDEKGSLDFRVRVPPDDETAPLGMHETALRRLAEGTGGRFYREEELDQLPDFVAATRTTVTLQHDAPLWNWTTFIFVVLLLSAEWIIRRRSGMS